MVQFSRKKRLASLSNFLSLFCNCLRTNNVFLFSSCRTRISNVYNIDLGLKCLSEADIRRISNGCKLKTSIECYDIPS